MIYDKGGAIREIWNRVKAKGFIDFEKKMADTLATQLGVSTGVSKKVKDPELNVDYWEHPAVTKYLELLKKKDAKTLDKPFLIGGKSTGITLGQAGEVLRYGRSIQAISEVKPKLTPKLKPAPIRKRE